jgi:hypothetical protein
MGAVKVMRIFIDLNCDVNTCAQERGRFCQYAILDECKKAEILVQTEEETKSGIKAD